MLHAQPFASFSCKSFKEPPLGAELSFFTQRASFFNKIESDEKASKAKFQKISDFKNKQIPTGSAKREEFGVITCHRPVTQEASLIFVQSIDRYLQMLTALFL
jgi:hypothetical protein